MSEFPPDKWYDPPELHEICVCKKCHESGEHMWDMKMWVKEGCEDCEIWMIENPKECE